MHTPGPWKAGYNAALKLHFVAPDGSNSVPLNADDARLIAAAPEMRQTIKDLVDVLGPYIEYGQMMRKVGRGFSTTDSVGRHDDSVLAGAHELLDRIGRKGE